MANGSGKLYACFLYAHTPTSPISEQLLLRRCKQQTCSSFKGRQRSVFHDGTFESGKEAPLSQRRLRSTLPLPLQVQLPSPMLLATEEPPLTSSTSSYRLNTPDARLARAEGMVEERSSSAADGETKLHVPQHSNSATVPYRAFRRPHVHSLSSVV